MIDFLMSEQLFLLAREIKKTIEMNINDEDLTFNQIQILLNLFKSDESITQDKLSQEIGMDKSNVSRNLLKLANNNYIEFIDNDRDSRKKTIILTPRAISECQRVLDILYLVQNKMFENISNPEIINCMNTLEKMFINLK